MEVYSIWVAVTWLDKMLISCQETTKHQNKCSLLPAAFVLLYTYTVCMLVAFEILYLKFKHRVHYAIEGANVAHCLSCRGAAEPMLDLVPLLFLPSSVPTAGSRVTHAPAGTVPLSAACV